MKENSSTSSTEPNFDFGEASREEEARREEMRAIQEERQSSPSIKCSPNSQHVLRGVAAEKDFKDMTDEELRKVESVKLSIMSEHRNVVRDVQKMGELQFEQVTGCNAAAMLKVQKDLEQELAAIRAALTPGAFKVGTRIKMSGLNRSEINDTYGCVVRPDTQEAVILAKRGGVKVLPDNAPDKAIFLLPGNVVEAVSGC